MKKITFYGQDFSPIDDASVKVEENGQKHDYELRAPIGDDFGGLTYGDLLNQFVYKYPIPKQGKEEEEEVGGDRLYFPLDHDRFGRWVGVFRHKKFKEETTSKEFDITLEIRCRFDTTENEEENKGEKAYFLAAMLLRMPPEELKRLDREANISFDQVMDIFLLFMYKNQLTEAVKKGIFRKYQRFENNDSRPHGTIDIARHIRENMGLKSGRIAYHYRELTADNSVNRLILTAYKRLCGRFPSLCDELITRDESVCPTLNMLQTELGWSRTSLRSIVKENLRPVTHPYFSEYEDLRKTCLRILRDEGVSIFDAEDGPEETDAICFDITRLWEKYLESRFKDLVAGPVLSPQKSDTFLRGLKDNKGKTAKPDFLFHDGNKNIAILDAKFKPDWKDRELKYLTEDIDECIRNMVVFWTDRTGVIYPCDSEGGHEEFSIIGDEIRKDKNRKPEVPERLFDVVRVAIPKIAARENFNAWSERLDERVNDILGKYLDVLGIPMNPRQ